MADQRCEHCAALSSSMEDSGPADDSRLNYEHKTHGIPGANRSQTNGSPDSGNTRVGTHGNGSVATVNGHLERTDNARKDEEKGGEVSSPEPVGVFHSSLSKLRWEVFGLWARTVLMLCVFILCVLSFYWAVLYHVEENVSSLDVFVVDFDGTQPPYHGGTPLVGPMITQTTEMMLRSPNPHLGFVTMTPAQFNNDPILVRQAIYDFKAYAAIVINANATALLRAAVETGNSSYDPLGACQVIWIEARDQETYYNYILPALSTLETNIISKFSQQWTSTVLRNTSIPLSNLQAAPQALSPAVGFSQYSLRPFNPPAVTPAVTIGLIYLIIIAFFSFSFFLPIYNKLITPQGHPQIKFWKFILIRYTGTTLAYLFMSLAYSLISLAFQIPFARSSAPATSVANNPTAHGSGTWAVYWMINFVGMSALGLACENVAMLVGQPWTALWLIFWVIANVSTSFYSLDLAPKFYYWGYAWPLHNIVEASRSTLFDLHSRIGLNFGILFAWVGINSVLFPACCYFMRWKGIRGKKKQAREEEEEERRKRVKG